jgi:hypothetical protein
MKLTEFLIATTDVAEKLSGTLADYTLAISPSTNKPVIV